MVYLQVLARMIGIVFFFPFFNWRGVPVLVRIWLAMILALLIFASLGEGDYYYPTGGVEAVGVILKEALTGLTLGYLVMLFFSLFLAAGQFIDLKAGLLMAGEFNPQFGNQVTLTGQLYYLVALIFYLTVNGHHYLLKAAADSFNLIPLGTGLFKAELTGGLVRIFGDIFVLAFQLSAPVILVLLLVDFALGLLAKTVPQIHVFVEGLPLKIALSMVLVAILLPFMGGAFESLMDNFSTQLYDFMQGWF
jgi:flagellar biosynthetic protein FliR